jgi:hypothetical protein
MLENLTNPAPKVELPNGYRPGIEFDGTEGTAQTPGLQEGADFKQYLQDAGFNLDQVEIIGAPRISRWQVIQGGEPVWLTSYRFRFQLRNEARLDLPLLYKEALKGIKRKAVTTKSDKALVVLWSDLQVGKAGETRGGTKELIERVAQTTHNLVAQAKALKPARIVFCDVGDIIEGFESGGNPGRTNDLSLMQQVDLATTLTWTALKELAQVCDDVVYLTVGSNHCQWRQGKTRLGNTLDDWGVHIGRTLARLATETELPIRFYEPEQNQETLAFDVFDDQFHILGLFHGHQAQRPENIPGWIKGQVFGHAPTNSATLYVSGHFHHLRLQELGVTPRGSSRYWVQAKTLDAGSSWYRLQSGEDSSPGLVTFTLERNKEFQGTIQVL